MLQKIILTIIAIFCLCSLSAQSLIKTIPLTKAQCITTDELGNVYVVSNNNGLVRYDLNGDSTSDFRIVQNGKLYHVDATNPLKVLAYYTDFSKIVLLDRMLTAKNEINLKQINLYNPPAVGISADGKVWVYDNVNAKLKKIDEQMKTLLESNDLRIETETAPQPIFLVEKNNNIYLCDKELGIYVFDRQANYLHTLDIKDINSIQVINNNIYFFQNQQLLSFSLSTYQVDGVILPAFTDKIIDIKAERSRLYILFKDRLEIHGVEE